jgi:ubiquinone/menaquinone biosynthesis C-methylase UbiE
MRRLLTRASVFLAAGAAVLAAQTAPTHHAADRLHGDPRAYMAALDDPSRDAWQKPHEVVAALGLSEGQRVADIGAGSGYFALRFAHRVGPAGRVFAVDISRDMIAELRRRAAEAGLQSVDPILARPDDPGLPDAGVDLIFICDTWHHIERRDAYLARLRRALAPGGRLAIVDFHKEAPVGPPAGMKLAREEVLAEAERAGFRLVTEHTFLPHQYFLVFRPS